MQVCLGSVLLICLSIIEFLFFHSSNGAACPPLHIEYKHCLIFFSRVLNGLQIHCVVYGLEVTIPGE